MRTTSFNLTGNGVIDNIIMESSNSNYDSSSSNDGIVEDNVDSNDGTDSNCSDDGNISDSNDRVKGRGPENPSKERATAAQKSSHCEHKSKPLRRWEQPQKLWEQALDLIGRGPKNPSKERATAAQKSSHCEQKRASHCGYGSSPKICGNRP